MVAASSVEPRSQSDRQICGNLQTYAENGIMSTVSELGVEELVMQHSSSISDAKHASNFDSNNAELLSASDVNCLHVTNSPENSEKDLTVEKRRKHSPSTGTAHAFINKNYCANVVPRASCAVRKDSEANETSLDVTTVSDTGVADVWVRQYSKPLKLKTETSV